MKLENSFNCTTDWDKGDDVWEGNGGDDSSTFYPDTASTFDSTALKEVKPILLEPQTSPKSPKSPKSLLTSPRRKPQTSSGRGRFRSNSMPFKNKTLDSSDHSEPQQQQHREKGRENGESLEKNIEGLSSSTEAKENNRGKKPTGPRSIAKVNKSDSSPELRELLPKSISSTEPNNSEIILNPTKKKRATSYSGDKSNNSTATDNSEVVTSPTKSKRAMGNSGEKMGILTSPDDSEVTLSPTKSKRSSSSHSGEKLNNIGSVSPEKSKKKSSSSKHHRSTSNKTRNGEVSALSSDSVDLHDKKGRSRSGPNKKEASHSRSSHSKNDSSDDLSLPLNITGRSSNDGNPSNSCSTHTGREGSVGGGGGLDDRKTSSGNSKGLAHTPRLERKTSLRGLEIRPSLEKQRSYSVPVEKLHMGREGLGSGSDHGKAALTSKALALANFAQQLERKSSLRQLERERKHPSQQFEHKVSSPEMERKGSSRLLERKGSGRVLERKGSSRQLERKASGHQLERKGSSHQLERKPSSYQLERKPSSYQLEQKSPTHHLERKPSLRRQRSKRASLLENPEQSSSYLEAVANAKSLVMTDWNPFG